MKCHADGVTRETRYDKGQSNGSENTYQEIKKWKHIPIQEVKLQLTKEMMERGKASGKSNKHVIRVICWVHPHLVGTSAASARRGPARRRPPGANLSAPADPTVLVSSLSLSLSLSPSISMILFHFPLLHHSKVAKQSQVPLFTEFLPVFAYKTLELRSWTIKSFTEFDMYFSSNIPKEISFSSAASHSSRGLVIGFRAGDLLNIPTPKSSRSSLSLHQWDA